MLRKWRSNQTQSLYFKSCQFVRLIIMDSIKWASRKQHQREPSMSNVHNWMKQLEILTLSSNFQMQVHSQSKTGHKETFQTCQDIWYHLENCILLMRHRNGLSTSKRKIKTIQQTNLDEQHSKMVSQMINWILWRKTICFFLICLYNLTYLSKILEKFTI